MNANAWSMLVTDYAETKIIGPELYQKVLLFIARRALSRARTYVPGFQWETLYGRLPWWRIKKELGISNSSEKPANGDEIPDYADDQNHTARNASGVPIEIDVERFADAVRQVFDELRPALAGPSGLRKLAKNKADEKQIDAWLAKTVDRKLRDIWEKNCPEQHKFYAAAIGVLKKHFVLIHSKSRPGDGIKRGFYCVRQNWWGHSEWLRELPRPSSEYEILERLERVEVIASYSISLSLKEKQACIKTFFDACFAAVGGPIPEQVLIEEAKKFFGVADADPPSSLDGQAEERDNDRERPIADRLEDRNSQTAFKQIALECDIKGLVQEMSPCERRIAESLYEKLDRQAGRATTTEGLPSCVEKAVDSLPTSTRYYKRKKILNALTAEGPENFHLLLDLLELRLEAA